MVLLVNENEIKYLADTKNEKSSGSVIKKFFLHYCGIIILGWQFYEKDIYL